MRSFPALAALLAALPVAAANYDVTPANYASILASLVPGDTMNMAAGTYPLLNLNNRNGTAGARITIQGPASGAPAIVTLKPDDPDCCNIVQVNDASFLTIRNLAIDSALRPGIDGLKAQGVTHDILVEGNTFLGQGGDQQTVAISTKGTAWGWVIRANEIREAGTGLYLGNSDGSFPFIKGVIEDNLIVDTIGYNAQVKFQTPYSQPPGLPAGPHRTVIRNNVFIKTRAQSSWPTGAADGARPNLLLGGFPTSGFGTNDSYEVYGNFFFDNRDGEPLMQASGVVAAHDNVFVGGMFRAMSFVDHDLPLRRAYAYHNTIYGPPNGISVSGGSIQDSMVSGNLVFAASGVVAPSQQANIVATVANAGLYVKAPSMALGTMDFYPKPGMARGAPLDMAPYAPHLIFNTDFNGASKDTLTFRGAYAGEGNNPGWPLQGTRKARVRPQAVPGQTVR